MFRAVIIIQAAVETKNCLCFADWSPAQKLQGQHAEGKRKNKSDPKAETLQKFSNKRSE